MPRHGTVPENHPNASEWLRRMATAVNGLLLGRSNNTSSVTLAASQATTTITSSRITADTVALLMPTTANAAADLAAGIYQTASAGQIVLTHPNNANADKTFRVVLVG